jgi:hypothetical protein
MLTQYDRSLLPPQEADSYIGFVVPKVDAIKLRTGGFNYDSENDCLRGYLEDEIGDVHLYNYYPDSFTWEERYIESDDFHGSW